MASASDVFLGLSLIASIPAAIISFPLEKKRQALMPDTKPFTWGIYIGLAGVFYGAAFFVITLFNALSASSSDAGAAVFLGALFGAVYGVSGWYTIKRRRVAFVITTILSFNIIWWIANSIYARNRWDELIAGKNEKLPTISEEAIGLADASTADASTNVSSNGEDIDPDPLLESDSRASAVQQPDSEKWQPRSLLNSSQDSVPPTSADDSQVRLGAATSYSKFIKPSGRVRRRRLLIIGAAAVAIIGAVAIWSALAPRSAKRTAADSASAKNVTALTAREIASISQAATVQIRAIAPNGSAIAQGSGFFISRDGIIATNLHVIEGARSLQVQTLNGDTYDDVFYITADPRRDIAILKVPVDDAKPLTLADSTEVDVGDAVYVMGNPLGQLGTFSNGLVSARRTVNGVSLLQITAPVSHGSSGGPVLSANGRVVGITTLMLEGGQNLNYAVPVRYLRPLTTTGETPRRYAADIFPKSRDGLSAITSRSQQENQSETQSGAARQAGTPSTREALLRSIYAQFRGSDSVAIASGASPIGDVAIGFLADEMSDTRELSLSAGRRYVIIAYCDQDCRDLDLRIITPSGSPLASDVDPNDHPLLNVTAPSTGKYGLKVIMADCGYPPCAYGVRLYATELAREQEGGQGRKALSPPNMDQTSVLSGQVINSTLPNSPATLRLVFDSVAKRTSGRVEIGTPLGGSGLFSAAIRGDSMIVLSVSQSGDTILWRGKNAESRVRGLYSILGGRFAGQGGTWWVLLPTAARR